MARYLSSAQGRFTSPDPLLASARLTDPQTWNRYAYVRNDPVNMVDPDGRAVIDPNVYQFYQSQFWTGNAFNAWFNQAMGNNTMADYNAMLFSYGLATIPGYAAPDPALAKYCSMVLQGQANLAADNTPPQIETQSKEDSTGVGHAIGRTIVTIGKAVGSVLGKVWNVPNTAIGLVWGLIGVPFGADIGRGHNAIQFTNHPFMPWGAITLGNVIVYPSDFAPNTELGNGTVGDHEKQHTYQGEMVGPFYLPLNIIGKSGIRKTGQGDKW